MNNLMISKWKILGNYQSRYVPGMIGPFLKVSLIPHTCKYLCCMMWNRVSAWLSNTSTYVWEINFLPEFLQWLLIIEFHFCGHSQYFSCSLPFSFFLSFSLFLLPSLIPPSLLPSLSPLSLLSHSFLSFPHSL